MRFEDRLSNVGDNGRFQALAFCLLGLCLCAAGAQSITNVFVAVKQEFWCADNITALAATGDDNFTKTQCTGISEGRESTNSSAFSVRSFTCTRWTFSSGSHQSTIQSHYDMVCDRAYLVTVCQTAYMAGFFVGSTAFGVLADRRGRLIALTVVVVVGAVVGALAPLSPHWLVYAAARCVLGAMAGGLTTVTYTLLAELVPTRHRLAYLTIIYAWWLFGHCAVTGLAFLIRRHEHLEVAVSLAMLGLLGVRFVLPESPRWLLIVGREADADVAFRTIAEWNRKSPSPTPTIAIAKTESSFMKPVTEPSSPFRTTAPTNLRPPSPSPETASVTSEISCPPTHDTDSTAADEGRAATIGVKPVNVANYPFRAITSSNRGPQSTPPAILRYMTVSETDSKEHAEEGAATKVLSPFRSIEVSNHKPRLAPPTKAPATTDLCCQTVHETLGAAEVMEEKPGIEAGDPFRTIASSSNKLLSWPTVKSTAPIDLNCQSIEDEQCADVEEGVATTEEPATTTTSTTILHLVGHGGIRRVTLLVWYCFFTASLVHYGLFLASNDFTDNIYVYSVAGGLLGVAAMCVTALAGRRLGRLGLVITASLGTAIVCFVCSNLVEDRHLTSLTVATLTGRTVSDMCFATMWVYVTEVYPSVLSGRGVGSASSVARVAGILAPQAQLVARWLSPAAPFFVYGALACGAALLALALPETRGGYTPDSLADARVFYRGMYLARLLSSWRRRLI